ncbi:MULTISPECIES: hypothetical protein [unclassified Microcoleus]|uniref:hypothetical protein n=1 Tax=unclassified Microcoleus TaxID=2642155 RepID=UPI002FD3A51D
MIAQSAADALYNFIELIKNRLCGCLVPRNDINNAIATTFKLFDRPIASQLNNTSQSVTQKLPLI